MKNENTETKPSSSGRIQRLVSLILSIQTEDLYHPESPGVKVQVTRSRFGRWVKPAEFATHRETIKSYIS